MQRRRHTFPHFPDIGIFDELGRARSQLRRRDTRYWTMAASSRSRRTSRRIASVDSSMCDLRVKSSFNIKDALPENPSVSLRGARWSYELALLERLVRTFPCYPKDVWVDLLVNPLRQLFQKLFALMQQFESSTLISWDTYLLDDGLSPTAGNEVHCHSFFLVGD